MKKPVVLLWKIFKKIKNHYKTCGFLKKRVVKPISIYGFGPWPSHTRLDKLWGTLTDKLFREPLVLLCVHSKMLKNHWFYCVFAQKYWKSIGFTVFSLKKVEKPLVLLQKCKKVKKPLVLQCSLCKWRLKLKKVKKPFVFPENNFGLTTGTYEKLVLL